jgi:hypothetical protein
MSNDDRGRSNSSVSNVKVAVGWKLDIEYSNSWKSGG